MTVSDNLVSMANIDVISLQGKLLVATPDMDDPNFRKSVVYLCFHDEEQAMGLIINRPKAAFLIKDLIEVALPDLAARADSQSQNSPHSETIVRGGGPVRTEQGFILHTVLNPEHSKALPEHSAQLSDTLFLSSHNSVLAELASPTPPEKATVAMGYSGWSPLQLEDEIMENCWLIVESDMTLLFDTDPDDIWEKALAKLGILPVQLAAQSGSA